jgi:hypothetical protein
MLVLLSGLVGALIGASVTGGFQIWKFRRDELTARCDELCRAISHVATLASQYWATKFDDHTKARIAEAEILGSQALCDGLYAALRYRLIKSQGRLDVAMAEFIDALTGGDFTVEGRAVDVERVASAPQASSVLIVELRQAHHDTMPFSRLLQTVRENQQRELDLPRRWQERVLKTKACCKSDETDKG